MEILCRFLLALLIVILIAILIVIVVIGFFWIVALIKPYGDNDYDFVKDKYPHNDYMQQLEIMKYEKLFGAIRYTHDKQVFLEMRAKETEKGIR